jgi:hypothetical protein
VRIHLIGTAGDHRCADLGSAQVEAHASTITVVALLGGAELIVPPGVPVQLSGLSLLGGKSDERTPGPPLAGAPLIRVRGFSILGGVAIKDRKDHGPGWRARLRAKRRRASPA